MFDWGRWTVPPLREWYPLWRENFRWLLSKVFPDTWEAMHTLRNDPPLEETPTVSRW